MHAHEVFKPLALGQADSVLVYRHAANGGHSVVCDIDIWSESVINNRPAFPPIVPRRA